MDKATFVGILASVASGVILMLAGWLHQKVDATITDLIKLQAKFELTLDNLREQSNECKKVPVIESRVNDMARRVERLEQVQ